MTKFSTCLAVLFAIFLALDVTYFGITIGFAWYGIQEANSENKCHTVNTTMDCILIEKIMPNNVSLELGHIPGFNYDFYLYWMGAATVCGLVWACINVLTLISLSELIRSHLGVLAKIEKKIASEVRELKTIAVTAEGGDNGHSSPKPAAEDTQSTPKPEAKPETLNCFTDRIGVVQDQEWLHKPLRNFGPLTILSLFLSSFTFICAILCLVWGIAISFDYARRKEKDVAIFIIVEVLVAVALPTFLCTSVALFAIVLEYITVGHLDMRMFIPRLIGVVKFEVGDKYDYWVIDDIFYYCLKKKLDRSDKGCCFSVDKSPATWFLTIIIGTSFHLVISYFFDLTLDKQVTVTSCNNTLIDRSYDCFNASTLAFINCLDNTETRLLHCFKFYRFGVETNIITAITTSYAFYLVTIAVFKHMFSVVRKLIHVKPSRFWGVGFLAVGLIFLTVSIIVAVFWIRGYAGETISELRRLKIIHISQFFMVSIFVIMVGGLLLSKWYEKLNTKVHAQTITVPLVHYHNTQRKHLHTMETADTWPPPADNNMQTINT